MCALPRTFAFRIERQPQMLLSQRTDALQVLEFSIKFIKLAFKTCIMNNCLRIR